MKAIILLMALLACSVTASLPMMRMPSPHGDARLARATTLDSTYVGDNLWNVPLPPGQHQAFTVCGWVRLKYVGTAYITTQAFWSPEPIQRSNPDLLAGAAGCGSAGTNLTTLGGSITVASFPFEAYTDATLLATWPKGVYTVAGWSSNAVTVTLGGTDMTVGPGAFNRNMIPGPAASCVISGAGLVAIGIGRTPGARFYGEIDGVMADEGTFFTPDSIITNELVFVSYRFRRVAGSKQVYQSTLGRLGNHSALSQVKTNGMTAAAYDSTGHYQVGVVGLGGEIDKTFDWFDFRVRPWWMSDDELQAVWRNGVDEIGRRGIPQWR